MATDFDRKFKRYANQFATKSIVYTLILGALGLVSIFSEVGIGISGFTLGIAFIISLFLVLKLNKKRSQIIKEIEDAIDDGADEVKKYKTRCNIMFLVPVVMFVYLIAKLYIIPLSRLFY